MFTTHESQTHATSRGPLDKLPNDAHENLDVLANLLQEIHGEMRPLFKTVLGELDIVTGDLRRTVQLMIRNPKAAHHISIATVMDRALRRIVRAETESPPPSPPDVMTPNEAGYASGIATSEDLLAIIRASPPGRWHDVTQTSPQLELGELWQRLENFTQSEQWTASAEHLFATQAPRRGQPRPTGTVPVPASRFQAVLYGLIDNATRLIVDAENDSTLEHQLFVLWSMTVNMILFGHFLGPIAWSFGTIALGHTSSDMKIFTGRYDKKVSEIQERARVPQSLEVIRTRLSAKLTADERLMEVPSIFKRFGEFKETQKLGLDTPELIDSALKQFKTDNAEALKKIIEGAKKGASGIDTMRIDIARTVGRDSVMHYRQLLTSTGTIFEKGSAIETAMTTADLSRDVTIWESLSISQLGSILATHGFFGVVSQIVEAYTLGQLRLENFGAVWSPFEALHFFGEILMRAMTLSFMYFLLWTLRKTTGVLTQQTMKLVKKVPAVNWLIDALTWSRSEPLTEDRGRALGLMDQIGTNVPSAYDRLWVPIDFARVVVNRGIRGVMSDVLRRKGFGSKFSLSMRFGALWTLMGGFSMIDNILKPYAHVGSFYVSPLAGVIGISSLGFLAHAHYQRTIFKIDPNTGRTARRFLLASAVLATVQAANDLGMSQHAADVMMWTQAVWTLLTQFDIY